ncbi:MAG: response regulator [Lachnospiraceae bacterium]
MWRVMVADDETYMLEAFDKLIDWEKMNCQLVYRAANGKEVIRYLEKMKPDIIITDIKMPLMDGIEVARYIYENKLPIQVILLTAYADFAYAQEAISYDVCGYVVKTSMMEMLPGMIEKAIKKLRGEEPKEESERFSEDIFERLQKYIEQNYMNKVTLSDISSEIHSNPSYLSRLYKQKTGQNLFDNINRMKLEKAKQYIARGYRIFEVAELVGFEDVSYFSRVFKKLEGCSPRDYEKRVQNKDRREEEE